MKAEYVEKTIRKLKRAMSEEIDRQNYEIALKLISMSAYILYNTNIRYMDEELENALANISKKLPLNGNFVSNGQCERIMFWDGFGLNDRGLVQIYLNAISKFNKVVYVTYEDRKDQIPDIINILSKHESDVRFISRSENGFTDRIFQLNQIILEFQPSCTFIYTLPDDVVVTTLMFYYKGVMSRFQINLTDHAFWLGAKCCDKCINFRGYGAKISKEYRNIPESKNLIIPFYPSIDRNKEFQGYPFKLGKNQKIMFSGGALYKTFGDNNKYYNMITHVMLKHKNLIFWFSGDGDDTELKKLMLKFPGRVFHTQERSDLFQLLEKCHLYFSTYPMCGGLMFQYAAMAGLVPVTLKQGNISDDFLIDQEKIQVEFWDVKELYHEVDMLLLDDHYARERSDLMRRSVISPDIFEDQVRALTEGKSVDRYMTEYEHVDTKSFREWYLTGFSNGDIASMTVSRELFRIALKHYPLVFLHGWLHLKKKRLGGIVKDAKRVSKTK